MLNRKGFISDNNEVNIAEISSNTGGMAYTVESEEGLLNGTLC